MSKDTHDFANESQDYEPLRCLIRRMFLYGDSSRGDLLEAKRYGKTSAINTLVKRMENYFSKNFVTFSTNPERSTDKRCLRLVYDPFKYPVNYLLESFQECTYGLNDIVFFFTLMQSLYDEDYEENCIEEHVSNDADEYHINLVPYIHMGFDETSIMPADKFLTYIPDNMRGDLSSNIAFSCSLFDSADFISLTDLIPAFMYNVYTNKAYLAASLGRKPLKTDVLTMPFSTSTFRNLFNQVLDLGIFRRCGSLEYGIKEGKTKTSEGSVLYQLSDDIFSDLRYDTEKLQDLRRMACFFYNYSDIAVPGWQLAKTITLYLAEPGDGNETTKDLYFQFTGSCAHNVIDNDVLWELIKARHELRAVKFTFSPYDVAKDPYELEVFPIKVISEHTYGRQYLFAYNYNSHRFKLYRLDRISYVKSSSISNKELFSFTDAPIEKINTRLNSIYEEKFEYAWNVDVDDRNRHFPILLHFSTDAAHIEQFMHLVKMRSNKGRITRISDNRFDYEVTVNGLNEITPWIRSFGSSVLVDKEVCPELYERIKNDYKEILAKYESV